MFMSATPETIKMAKDVLAVQDACNSGGVSNLYHDCVHKLLYQHRDREGTEWVNQNPLAVCLLDKLCSLARIQGCGDYESQRIGTMFDKVKLLAEGVGIEWEVV